MKPTAAPTAVRRARDARGLSQVALALKAGVSLSTVRLAEAGILTWRTARRLGAALEVPPDQLASATDAEPEGVARG